MSEGRKSRVDVMATKVTPVKPTINRNIVIGDGHNVEMEKLPTYKKGPTALFLFSFYFHGSLCKITY